ncbi:MAG: hypothetical protein PUA56_00680 [Bacillales bacterium]|nr:hypothetical protein [Bacillales bacterium]
MNEETIEKIKELKTQLIFLFVLLIALLLSVIITNDLIFVAKGKDYDGSINRSIKKKAVLSALLTLLVSGYFLYLAYKTYIQKRTKSNEIFLIIGILVLIAAILRYYNLTQPETIITGADDVVL